MRILLLTQYFFPETGAAQARLSYLGRHLKGMGEEVTVVTASPSYPRHRLYPGYRNRFRQRETWEGITVWRTWVYLPRNFHGFARLLNFLSFPVSCLVTLFSIGRVDVIVVETPPIFLAFSARVFRLFKCAPILLMYSDLWVKAAIDFGFIPRGWPARFALSMEKTALRSGASIAACTQGLMDDLLARGFPPGRLHLVTNGVDCDRYQPGKGSADLRRELGWDGKYVVMYAGTLTIQAGLDVLLDSAERLRDHPDVVLAFVGDGAEFPRVSKAVQDRGLANVQFLGPKPEENLAEYLRLADAGINTLSSDPVTEHTLSVKVFAYMACALPVLCTDRREVRSLLETSGAGLLFPPDDPQAIVQAIVRLRSDPALAARLGRNGLDYVRRNYNRRDKTEALRQIALGLAASTKRGTYEKERPA
jgi:glycosyltransferase involved in cell wall biosynthesis